MKPLYAILAGLLLSVITTSLTAFELIEDEIIAVPDISGAWYDPEAPGYGILIDDVESVGTFVAWFTYNFEHVDAGQAWYVGYEPIGHRGTFNIGRPSASFPSVGYVQADPIGYLTIDVLGDNEILVNWHFSQEVPCVTPRVSPSPAYCDGSAILTKLLPQPPEG